MNWPARTTTTTLCVLVASCTALFDYPEPKRETGEVACSDGVDNDYDRLSDCADPSCDGFCLEQDASSCEDGRDNDGDGLADGDDPRCWPNAGPRVTRCASREWADFEERFDGELSTGRWYLFGTLPDGKEPVVQLQRPSQRPIRLDKVLGFNTLGPYEGVLGGIGSVSLVDGDWRALDLSFQARLVEGGLVRVALVPATLAPPEAEPTTQAKDASLMVELDARGKPTVTLQADFQRASIPWGHHVWHTLHLHARGAEIVLALHGPGSEEPYFETSLPLPEMGPSRLVVWGESKGVSGPYSAAQIDDLRLVVGAARPCGVASPQIPLGASCRTQPAKRADDLGFSLAVAGPSRQHLCALVAAAPAGEIDAAEVQAWSSADGGQWERAGTAWSSAGTPVVGAGLGWDGAGGAFRAVVATRTAQEVRLERTESAGCRTWSAPAPVADLPADAEAPSYLVPGVVADHEIYFTRPASGSRDRTLWRLRSGDGSTFVADAELVAELPNDLMAGAPVALSRVGADDLVLVYPVAADAGELGLGMAVAMDHSLQVWRRVGGWPAVSSKPGAFDGEAVVSGALWQGADGAFLLYAGRGQPLDGVPLSLSPLTVGSAWVALAGASPVTSEQPSSGATCGDGRCEAAESCSSCEIDCGVCEGDLVASERFDNGDDWRIVAPWQQDIAASIYVDRGLRLEPSRAAWFVRDLPLPVLGDFELGFDVHMAPPHDGMSDARCAAYVGLGRAPRDGDMAPDGVFARVDQQRADSDGVVAFGPEVRVAGRSLPDEQDPKTVAGTPERWHRVHVRRETGRVSVRVTSADGCEIGTSEPVAYAGSLADLDTLLVGWGNTFGRTGWTSGCDDATAAVTVDNIVLRSLPCPQGGRTCPDDATGRTFCVDLNGSPENCGACRTEVSQAQICEGGKPFCVGTVCPDADGGPDVCVKLASSREHCGACGRAVGEHESCAGGLRVAKLVRMPKGFFIDATEVTRGQYADWLATKPSRDDQIQACASWNTSYEPSCRWPADQADRFPVTCVDWCDADAYCRGVGKRLCGKIGGGAADFASWQIRDPDHSQWLNACTSGGEFTFPYGDKYDGEVCNGLHYPDSACIETDIGPLCELVEVASAEACQSPVDDFAGVYDLSGNVVEWVDACETESGPLDSCRWHGSAAHYPAMYLRCDNLGGERPRMRHDGVVGFRCCAL